MEHLQVKRLVRGPNKFSYKSSDLYFFFVNTIASHIDLPSFHLRPELTVSGPLIDMEKSSTSHRQGVFPFKRLPLEVRRIIYTFAAISVPLIELRISYYRGATSDTSVLGRVRLYTVHDFRILATDHEFRKEMSDALYAKNAFDISLCREQVGEGICLHQIDLGQIKKCRLILHKLGSPDYFPHMDVWGGSFPFYWHHHVRAFVATLVLYGHQMESMLVECEPQNPKWLLECLRPVAMLRRIGLIHFRSASPEIYPYFRFLEARIMSDQDVPVKNQQEFQAQTHPWRPHLSRLDARRDPPPRSTDMTDESRDC